MKMPMLTNSKGKASASFTMTFIAFNLVCLWLALSILCPVFGVVGVPPFDGGAAMAFLAPVMALYFGRRKTEDETPKEKSSEEA